MAETSDTKFLNTCRRLLDIFAGEARWKPSNAALETVNLETKLASGFPIALDVMAKLAPQVIKINDRQETYAKVAPMVRSSRRYLKSSGASSKEIDDANTIINKILGVRSTPKPKVDPNQPAAAVENSNSVSRQSYDSRLGNLLALREYYANVTDYKPNENTISIGGLDALTTEMQAGNDAVSAGSSTQKRRVFIRRTGTIFFGT